ILITFFRNIPMSQYPSVPTSQYRNILYISISLYISFPFYFFYLFCLYYYYTLSPFAASCFPLVSSYYCLVLPSLLSTVLYSQIIMDETDHGFNQPSGHSEGSNPKRRNRKKLLIVLIFFLIILLTAGGLAYYTYSTGKKNDDGQKDKSELTEEISSSGNEPNEVDRVVAEVKTIMLLPDETPRVATITNLEEVKKQIFFEKAALGDKVLIYMQEKIAILYRPSSKMIIKVGYVNDQTGQVAGENISIGEEPTPVPEAVVSTSPVTPAITLKVSPTSSPAPDLSTEY
ncbi:MAG: hypothetical protein US95_C0018G0001, partial [Candidatus Woesebacteria bacterium GW2011_GWB1_38_5]